MSKYQITANVTVSFVLDTTEASDDFAQTKDELVDKLDPEDPDVIHDYIVDLDPGDLVLEYGTDGIKSVEVKRL